MTGWFPEPCDWLQLARLQRPEQREPQAGDRQSSSGNPVSETPESRPDSPSLCSVTSLDSRRAK